VVDDLAQAAGTSPPPGEGRLGAVSCYPTKLWGAAGDAGFVVSDDDGLLRAVRALGNHGLTGVHHHQPVGDHVGRNSRLDAVQAAVLVARTRGFGAEIECRRALAARYDAALDDDIVLRRDPGNPVPQYVLDLDDRDAVRAELDAAGIDSVPLYPRALPDQPALRGRMRARPTPMAARCARRFLAVPCHGGLDDEAVERVIEGVVRATARRRRAGTAPRFP
jgi:dTDP-4-amino-4,6-dideoxygalactose transaminase